MKALLLPALLIGGGYAIFRAAQKSREESAVPPGARSIEDLGTEQKAKITAWAKAKGLPVEQAYNLAKSVMQTKAF